MTQDIFRYAADDNSHIVAFRTEGAGRPLFCLPGSGGNVNVFREMVAALPEGQPIYAVDMEWLCEARQDFTIEQLAVFCLDAIRKLQKSGPYYFCGYSFGGLVAYEVALRLINEGDNANLVALLDAPNPALISNLTEADSVRFRKTYRIDRFKKYAFQLVRGDIKAFTDGALAFAVSRLGKLFMPLIKIGFRSMNRPMPATFRANDPGFLKAWRSYIPKPYPRDLVSFRVQDRGPEHDRDPSMGWDSCAMRGVHVHVVPGDHVNMMSKPSVSIVANTLATYLDRG